MLTQTIASAASMGQGHAAASSASGARMFGRSAVAIQAATLARAAGFGSLG